MTMDRHKMKIDYLEQHTYDNMKITIEEQLHLYEKHPWISAAQAGCVL